MENQSSEVITVIETAPIPGVNFSLTLKQQRFIEAYKQLGDATKSAISAGYAPKSAHVEANRLLKNAKVLEAIKHWKIARQSQLSKDDFVNLALEDYKNLDVVEPNKPRFLDIAGKALGYTSNDRVGSITNNTQINIKTDIKLLSVNDKWNMLRSLMDNE